MAAESGRSHAQGHPDIDAHVTQKGAPNHNRPQAIQVTVWDVVLMNYGTQGGTRQALERD